MSEAIQEKFQLVITAEGITSTDKNFSMSNLGIGDKYKTITAFFEDSNGIRINRKHERNERRATNKLLPRIAFQIYKEQIMQMSDEEKEKFPVYQSSYDKDLYIGIYRTVQEFTDHYNTYAYLKYPYDENHDFVIYCWNVFSTILFVQECLKRFGNTGDKFILVYRVKNIHDNNEERENEKIVSDDEKNTSEFINPYSNTLLKSKNIIFRGAPGTGKTFLAKEIAADIISGGYTQNLASLSEEQKKQIAFVQFHPSYDYSDFVEGLRPKLNSDGTMGFELYDGIFKEFVNRARVNYEDSQKSQEVFQKELDAQELISDFFDNLEFGEQEFSILRGSKFFITDVDEKYIYVEIPENKISNQLKLSLEQLTLMLQSDKIFEKVLDIKQFFNKQNATQQYSYLLSLYTEIIKRKNSIKNNSALKVDLKPYVFIIDEINRGEISKIFGELFFSIDPGYRGKLGELYTQYANLHEIKNEKFYIPENVYIIGTMNDIDRSVDSFDFAMRRRFRFIEIKAEEHVEMLEKLGDELQLEALNRMNRLNQEISGVDELNENYHVGAAYFMKLSHLSFDELWTDYLQPLLYEYVRGLHEEDILMERFAKAYGYKY